MNEVAWQRCRTALEVQAFQEYARIFEVLKENSRAEANLDAIRVWASLLLDDPAAAEAYLVQTQHETEARLQGPAAGGGSELDLVEKGIEKVSRVTRTLGLATATEAALRPLPYDDDDAEPDTETQLRRELAKELARDPEYRKAVRERMLAELTGSRAKNPVQDFIERQREAEQLREALGLGKPERDGVPEWMQAARFVLEPLAPAINAWATAAFQQRQGQATPAQPALSVPGPMPHPAMPMPVSLPAQPPSAAAASVPVAPTGRADAAAVPDPTEQAGQAGGEPGIPADAEQIGPSASEPPQVVIVNQAREVEFALFRPVLAALLPHVDKSPDEAAQAAYEQLIEWQETAPHLDHLATAMFHMDFNSVALLASAYADDPDLGLAIQQLFAKPEWCVQWYFATKQLLDEADDEADDGDEADGDGEYGDEAGTVAPALAAVQTASGHGETEERRRRRGERA